LIEVKRDYGDVQDDAKRLGKVKNRANTKRPLAWVIMAVLVNGKSDTGVQSEEKNVAWKRVQRYGFRRLSDCAPQKLPWRSDVKFDRWFDVVCYGKEI
jgi:hypothetical protein